MIKFWSHIILWLQCILINANIHSTDTLYRSTLDFGVSLPQEKVYLHLDNTCYFTGDTIWYKGYVTRSDKGTLTDLSKILYVELLTPDGFLAERQQLEMPNGTANGAFTLTDFTNYGHTHGECSTSDNTNIRMPNGARTLSITRKWPRTSSGIMKNSIQGCFPSTTSRKNRGFTPKT